jgi:hypothetical protein
MSTFDEEPKKEPEKEPEQQITKPPTVRTLKKRAKYAREWRQRQREAEKARLASLTPADIWARNRATLTPEQLVDLEERQQHFVILAYLADQIVQGLPKGLPMGPQPDGSDGLPYADCLFTELQEFNLQTNPANYIVGCFTAAELVNLYAADNEKILALFIERDLEYIKFGFRTRFRFNEWDAFVGVVAKYIRLHPDHPDFCPDISKQIIAEYEKLHPKRAVQVFRNISEDHRSPSELGDSWVELQNDKERLRSMRDLANTPFKN